jgi:protein SCO1/2
MSSSEPLGRVEAAPNPAAPPRQPSSRGHLARLITRPAFWFALIALVLVIPLGRALRGRGPEEPKLRIPLPAFELVNQRSEPFGMAQLRGKVWVANFMFTSCPTVCPKLTRRMAEIQQRSRHLGDAFHLVTITVDPENDTPEVLARYAEANGAQPGRWWFLTGKLDVLEPTVVKGFKVAMGKGNTGDGLFGIFHGEHLVLVDREGTIRGYYGADDEGIERLLGDAGALVNAR